MKLKLEELYRAHVIVARQVGQTWVYECTACSGIGWLSDDGLVAKWFGHEYADDDHESCRRDRMIRDIIE